MIIWIIFAVITALVTAVLLHPLSSPGRAVVTPASSAGRVYRDQMTELVREVREGRISVDEYEIAKAETARRLFREIDADEKSFRPASVRFGKLALAGFLSITSISLYVMLGSPDLPSLPLKQRLANPGQDLAILMRKTEDHLQQAPDDGRGWDVIAPVYLRTNRTDDASRAYRNALRLLGPHADRLNGLAEALLASSGGEVTDEAKRVLEQSLSLEPLNPQAKFYLAMWLEQTGKKEKARDTFESIAKESPPGARWLAIVNAHIVKNERTPSIAGASGLSGADR